MTDPRDASQARVPAIVRLAALAPLDIEATMALDGAIDRARSFRPHQDILTEGQEISEPLLLLSGWAARVRVLEDGRRQVLCLLLPGDLIGLYGHDRPISPSTVIAITEVRACVAPAAHSPSLARAYALSRASEEVYLLAQITRVGRMNAQERTIDLLLELLDRLELAGLASDGRYVMPLRQDMMADILGLTPVHVNRTLQALRQQGWLNWKSRELILMNPDRLRRSRGYVPARVTAG